MKRILICIVWAAFAAVLVEAEELRTWTASGGGRVEAKLKDKSTIKQYDDAEKEMYELVSEHFATDIMDFRNNNCPEELTEDANEIAEKYSELKLSETIRRMGKPTKIP